MTETNIKKYLCDNYEKLQFTDSEIFGTVRNKTVVCCVVNGVKADFLDSITYVDKASAKNGGGYALKFRPNRAQWTKIVEKATYSFEVCTEELFESKRAKTKLNRGQFFEQVIADLLGATLTEKSNAKFTEAGDLIWKGVAYQVKYNKATYTNETTLRNLLGL